MTTISYHPVWEQKLTSQQKEEFEQRANETHLSENTVDITILTAKYKKNGGIVTTVFLLNGHPIPLDIHHIHLKIVHKDDHIVAEECFSPNLSIAPHSLQPWSFVFSSKNVFQHHHLPSDWEIEMMHYS